MAAGLELRRGEVYERAHLLPLCEWSKDCPHYSPEKGEQDKRNKGVVHTIDFDVTAHQLRHTYITNLLLAGVDVKTVQVLAGHEHAKMTLDIYAHLTYNQPKDLISKVNQAFANNPK